MSETGSQSMARQKNNAQNGNVKDLNESIVKDGFRNKALNNNEDNSVSSLSDFMNTIKKQFHKIIDNHLDRVSLIFSAFKFGSIQNILTELKEKHEEYAITHEEALQEFLNLKINERLEFKDDSYLDYDKIDNTFERNLKNGVRQPMVANLLTEQRLLNLLDIDDPEMLRPSMKFYETRETKLELGENERVNNMVFNKVHQVYVAFTSKNKGYIIDAEMNKSEIDSIPCLNVTCLTSYDKYIIVGNKRGDVYVFDNPNMEVTYHFNFSYMIQNVALSDDTGNNFFVTLPGNRTLHFRRQELESWKTEYMNTNIIDYWPQVNMGVVYYNGNTRIVTWEDGIFKVKKKLATGFVSSKNCSLSPDGKCIAIYSQDRLWLLEPKDFRELARLDLHEYLKVGKSILITSVGFFDDTNFGLCTVQGHICVLHYPSGRVHYEHNPEVILKLTNRK